MPTGRILSKLARTSSTMANTLSSAAASPIGLVRGKIRSIFARSDGYPNHPHPPIPETVSSISFTSAR